MPHAGQRLARVTQAGPSHGQQAGWSARQGRGLDVLRYMIRFIIMDLISLDKRPGFQDTFGQVLDPPCKSTGRPFNLRGAIS